MIKKWTILLSCLAVLLRSASVFTENLAIDIVPINILTYVNSEMKNKDGSTSYSVVNEEDVAEVYGLDNVKDIKVTYFNMHDDQPIITPRSDTVYQLSNISEPSEACGTTLITSNSSVNNSNLTITKGITLTGSVSNTYSATGGISASVISASLGFSVTKSWQMTDCTQVKLSPGQRVTVKAYPLYHIYTFKVQRKNRGNIQTVGSGNARKVIGFCTVTT